MLEQAHHSHSIGLIQYLSTLPSPSGRSNLHAKRTTMTINTQPTALSTFSPIILVTFPMFLMKSSDGFRKAYSHQQREQQQRLHHPRTAAPSLVRFDQSEKRIYRRSRKLHSQYYQGHGKCACAHAQKLDACANLKAATEICTKYIPHCQTCIRRRNRLLQKHTLVAFN